MPFIDYYAILRISRFATHTEIRAAYLSRCKEWHPDKNPGIDTTKMMQTINEAKNVLLDPNKRYNYDYKYNSFKASNNQQSQSKESSNNSHNQQETTNNSSTRSSKEKERKEANEKHYKELRAKKAKERYNLLKSRATLYKSKEPEFERSYKTQIRGKSNQELIDICLRWNEYTVPFIDLVIIELHERRNYELDSIYSLIKGKPKQVFEVTFQPHILLRIFFILAMMGLVKILTSNPF